MFSGPGVGEPPSADAHQHQNGGSRLFLSNGDGLGGRRLEAVGLGATLVQPSPR